MKPIGHRFTKNLDTMTTAHWNCARWLSLQCIVAIITFEDELLNVNKPKLARVDCRPRS